MPSITLQLLPSGPVVTAWVSVSIERATLLDRNKQPVPAPVSGLFLIDTGASCTCVDNVLIERSQLPQRGTFPMLTPSTGECAQETMLHEAVIFIPNNNGSGFITGPLQVAGVDLSNQGIQGLIGRDILSHTNFIYNGDAGIFTLAY